MIQKEVEVAKITTLADGTIRLSIDILSGNSEDISTAYKLKYLPTTMILVSTNDFMNASFFKEEKSIDRTDSIKINGIDTSNINSRDIKDEQEPIDLF
jgi:hypothetical protein